MKSGVTPVTSSFLFLLAILFIVTGCSSVQHDTAAQVDVIQATSAADLHNSNAIKATLLRQYKEWYKTPYKMGGLSKDGIDCSGFAYITFRSKFGYTLPRATESQAQTGKQVARNKLQTGDLVFFKTSLYYNHVGIYLGDSRFLHASTSKGVIISNLNEQYWKERYWTARRIDY
jgi:probable lipoprotein NlpC